jgi:hypothetical protein
MQIIMPEFVIPYERVPQPIIDNIKGVLKRELGVKIFLSTQIRMLLICMDPKKRMLPVLPGSLEASAPMKHVYTHNNFVMVNVVFEPNAISNDLTIA